MIQTRAIIKNTRCVTVAMVEIFKLLLEKKEKQMSNNPKSKRYKLNLRALIKIQ